MLLKKSNASSEKPSCDNGLGGHPFCVYLPSSGRHCGAGKLNKRKTGAGADSTTAGGVSQPSVYSVLCGGLVDGVEAMEREQHRRSARRQNVWHSMRSLPSPCACSNSP